MPPYTTGETGHYYYNDNQQPDAHYDGSHFDPYNTHPQQGTSEEPYQDEPNQGLSQGVSSDPLNHDKEEPSIYAEEFNARKGGCALRLPCTVLFRRTHTSPDVGTLAMCGRGDISRVALYGDGCVRV
jgi:hypothetical protein